jgi:hypothetical protein
VEDYIIYIIVAIWVIVAGAWKLLLKILGPAQTGKTAGQLGKGAKSLFEALTGENLEDLSKSLQRRQAEREDFDEAEDEEEDWLKRTALAPADERVSERPAPPPPFVPDTPPRPSPAPPRIRPAAIEAGPRRLEPLRPKPARPMVEEPEGAPKPRRRFVQPEPETAVSLRRRRRPSIVKRLGKTDRKALREAIVLREIFGPPKSLAGDLRPWTPRWSGGFAAAPVPAGRPAPSEGPAAKSGAPPHVDDMLRLGMITREQYDDLCRYFASRERPDR